MLVRRKVIPMLLTLGLSMAPALALAAPAAAADGDNKINLESDRTSGTDWTREDKIITIHDTDGDGVAIVSVEGSAVNGTRLVVAENTKAIIELNGVTIDLAGAGMRGPYHGIELQPGSVAEVQLAEGTANRLVGAYSNGVGGSGISVPVDTTLVITSPGAGNGMLDAIGWVAMPGIGGPGGGSGKKGGSITIDSGLVNAFGGDSAAGIGGGYRAKAGTVTINGGEVYAKGGNGVAGRNGGAGIGSGHGGVPAPIVITGGKVTGEGVFGGAGIGAGYQLGTVNGVNILISGGDITAIGTGGAAGIGSAPNSYAGAKLPNLIVVTGENTVINATSGRPVDTDGKTAIPAIGAGENDTTRTEKFVLVGDSVVLNGQKVAPNITLAAASGNTGAIAVTVPEIFKNVPDGPVRVIRSLDPSVDLYLETTAVAKPISFSTNGFDSAPGSIKAEELATGAVKVTFNPQEVDLPLFDTGPATPVFWENQSPILLAYVIVGVSAALITLVIGASAAARNRRYAPTL